MVWSCLASLNFWETNFRATGLKKTLKRKTLLYCNEKRLIVIEMTMFFLGQYAIKPLKSNPFR